jgi:hypothetical protein
VMLTVAGREYEVAAPRCARFSSSLPHFYRNDGNQTAVMTMICVVPPSPA